MDGTLQESLVPLREMPAGGSSEKPGQRFAVGMRVAIVNGPWSENAEKRGYRPLFVERAKRIGGTYGKIVDVDLTKDHGECYLLQPTGHIDGGPPFDLESMGVDWLYADELEVVD